MATKNTLKSSVSSKDPKYIGYEWKNILGLMPIHLIAVVGWPLYAFGFGGGLSWVEVSLAIFMYCLSAYGVCVGYHRGFSHKSYKMSKAQKFLNLFSGASAAEGTCLTWTATHRRHHRHEDTPQDPYNINKGFWWAHMGWIFFKTENDDLKNCPDLLKDKMVMHQHNHYTLWFLVSSFGLPIVVGLLADRFWGCLLFAGFVRIFFVNHVTFLINSWAHYFGNRPYSTKITARDSLFCALLTWGEGWHNFHHRFPFDYRMGHRFYHWDPAKWFIQLGSKLGMIWDLKTTPEVEIYRARLQVLTEKAKEESACERLQNAAESAFEKWHIYVQEFQAAREHLKERNREKYKQLQFNMKEARKDFREAYRNLTITLRRPASTT